MEQQRHVKKQYNRFRHDLLFLKQKREQRKKPRNTNHYKALGILVRFECQSTTKKVRGIDPIRFANNSNFYTLVVSKQLESLFHVRAIQTCKSQSHIEPMSS